MAMRKKYFMFACLPRNNNKYSIPRYNNYREFIVSIVACSNIHFFPIRMILDSTNDTTYQLEAENKNKNNLFTYSNTNIIDVQKSKKRSS